MLSCVVQDAANSDRHHLYNLLQYGKLYLAPISDDVQVRVLSACQDVTLTIFLESPRRRYRNGYLGDVYSCSYPTKPSPADTLHREFADLFPSATVTGTDLSPIQPSWVPPNVQFEVDDCTDEWLYGKDTFDFVHIRGLYGCVSDWDHFYKQAFKYVTHINPPSSKTTIKLIIMQQQQRTQARRLDRTSRARRRPEIRRRHHRRHRTPGMGRRVRQSW